jgi:extracellular factor (EF) 3-hydroxypalmitic acid methyl ester biosynthesis protein
MARTDVRCRAEIPVVVVSNGFSEGEQSKRVFHTRTLNIGLGGAFLNSAISIPEAEKVRIRATLPDYGELEIPGMIRRAEKHGIAVSFVGLEEKAKAVLWEAIKRNLEEDKTCPYCSGERGGVSERCAHCGLHMNFRSPEYLQRHETEKVAVWSEKLDASIEEIIVQLSEIEDGIFAGRLGYDEKTYLKVEKILLHGLDCFEEFEKVAGSNSGLLKEKRVQLRTRTDHLFRKSYFMNHARTWPKGYPGDYKMLENLYRNSPLSEGLGYFMDFYFLSRTLGIAVRERLAFMRELIRAELASRSNLKLLNLACGSSREILELAKELKSTDSRVICVDHDGDALDFSLNRLSYAGLSNRVVMRKYNVIRMVDHDRNVKEFGPQDVIYSMGLYDYLTDNVLIRLFSSQYKMLLPSGKAILTFKDSRRYRTQDYHWYIEWDAFYQRTAEESRDLVRKAGIPDSAVETLRDPSGVILFYIVNKE